mgnify:CR=1 FL=1|tara:strand:+ start:309 stop:1436 length:1128 start_codon:yes stop_codon:yes gene_type:complete
MRVTLKSDVFLDALSHAKKIVDKKSSIPILKHLLFKAEDAAVTLTSTDMEHSLTEVIPALVEERGKIAILAHILSDIVQKIPSGSDVTLTAEEGASRVILTSGRSKFEVACLSSEDFPKVGDKDLPHQFEIHSEGLKNLLSHTSFAASTEETRYHLQGVFFHSDKEDSNDITDSNLCAAATDGHRLACYRVPSPIGAENIPGFIISAKTSDVLGKLFESQKEMIQVSLSESQICFKMDQIELSARLVDADFPDYRAVIPQENSINISLKTDLFKQALERVSAVCDSKTSGVRLSLSDNEMHMTTIDKEYGSADDVLDISYAGTPIQIGFNHSYLRDISNKIANQATLEIGDSTSAIVMKDADDQNALYVLMPMRL